MSAPNAGLQTHLYVQASHSVINIGAAVGKEDVNYWGGAETLVK